MTRPGLLLVLSAPSGGGKTTICNRLLRHDRRLRRSISVTTRQRRRGERAGRDYYFTTEDKFRQLAGQGAFLEWARVHDHHYGTLKKEIAAKRGAGRDVVLVIDVQGGLAVKRAHPEAVLLFLQPPSLEVLAARLQGRGTDSSKTIARRLANARWELRQAPLYDYIVVNDRLGTAVRRIQAVILAERLRTPCSRKACFSRRLP